MAEKILKAGTWVMVPGGKHTVEKAITREGVFYPKFYIVQEDYPDNVGIIASMEGDEPGTIRVHLVREDGTNLAELPSVDPSTVRVATIEEIPESRLPDPSVAMRLGYRLKPGSDLDALAKSRKTRAPVRAVALSEPLTPEQNEAKTEAIMAAKDEGRVLSAEEIAKLVRWR